MTPRKLKSGPPEGPTKGLIIDVLAASNEGMLTGAVAKAVGLPLQKVRGHLDDLYESDRVIRWRVTIEGRNRVLWGAPGQTLRAPQEADPLDSIDRENAAWPRIVWYRPGAWRANALPAVRSVFDLGAPA